MRNFLLAASAFSGLTSALPQMINIEAAEAVPTPTVLGPKVDEAAALPVSYNPAAAAESVTAVVAKNGAETKKRDVCEPQPGGFTQNPGDGSVNAYLDDDSELRVAARAAKAPQGYTESFKDLTASTEQIGYLTYKNIESTKEYDVQACADFCDSENYCLGFNIYYERDPADDCNDAMPQTNLKCSIYGYPVSKQSATNQGQFRGDFQVVITGSNGYSKLDGSMCKPAGPVDDFNAPVDLKAAINAPLIQKDGKDYDTYNGMRLFNTNPYDPSLCAAACEAQTEFDKQHIVDADGNYKPCNFFTSYVLTKNGVPLGTYCALYTQEWTKEYAVNTGYYYGDDVYKVICAAGYTASTIDDGNVN
ncbi:hypothetical protein DDE82_007308 [Stemphylium lycopersici]|nr:hypothetical protein DDE82_007308 [Stemphylium lycopersici]